MTNEEHILTLYPAIQNDMAEFAAECAHLGAFIYYSRRSFELQAHLYALGRTIKNPEGIVTNAKPGLSFHNYGLAIDLVFKTSAGEWTWDKPRSLWMKLGSIAAEHGIEHGDRGYEDLPHFQKVFGQLPENLLACYNVNHSLQDVWNGLDEVRKEI
jgi:peptidoglycan L-alanyl-D-glutamate endopeptidase CwlK